MDTVTEQYHLQITSINDFLVTLPLNEIFSSNLNLELTHSIYLFIPGPRQHQIPDEAADPASPGREGHRVHSLV